MKNKSFILCIAGIGLLVVMGCYVFLRDGGMQPKMDTTDKQTEQEKNSIDNVDNNENEVDFLAFNEDVSENYQIENKGIILSIPQVEFEQFEEGTLEEKINMTLRKASTNWITEDMVNRYTCYEPSVYLNTKNLLSICQPFGTKAERSKFRYYINNYITMDMNSGEQIYLDDILDIEKFCDFLLKGEKYCAPDHQFTLDQEDADNAVREYLTNLSREKLMDILQCCCREQKDFVNRESRRIYKYYTPGLEEKPGFRLENTQLVLELDGEWHSRAIIEYKDLKDILNENFKQELLGYKKNMTENYKINSYKFVLSVPQVSFEQLEESTLEGSTLEEKINMTLCKESINWIADIIVTGYNSYLESTTYLNDNNLLSMGMTYHAQNELSDQEFYKHNFITMDMHSGEQIYLDDILDIEKFCDFLLKGEKYSASSFPLWHKKMDAEEIILKHLKKMKKQELLDILRYCCREQKEVDDTSSESGEASALGLEKRPKFYLQNSQMVIELDDEWHAFITITYKDLENVLNQDFKQRLVQCSVSEQKEGK